MNRICHVFLALFLLMKSDVLHCQIAKPFPEGLRIEAGLGYNFARAYRQPAPEYGIRDTTITWNTVFLTPTFRLSYQFQLLEWLSLYPFWGYDVFGGMRKSENLNEHIGFLFYSIDAGLFSNFKVIELELGFGFKYNKHVKIVNKYESGGKIEEVDVTKHFLFDDESFDLGMNISYIINHFTIESDFWFSTSNLYKEEFAGISYRKYRFIILVGYQF